jgi:hypothetical protein
MKPLPNQVTEQQQIIVFDAHLKIRYAAVS